MLIAQRIVRDVQREGLQPGMMLPPERTMLESYRIGRGTLREALRLLEFEGVVSLKPGPGGGPVLQRPTSSHLATTLVLLMQLSNAPYRAVVEARLALEPMISYLAAQRITDEALESLTRTVAVMEEHLDDRTTFLESNKEFHEIIAWSSGNSLFGYWVDSLLDIIDGTVLGIDYPPHRREAILNAHRNIAAALTKRDPGLSEKQMREHTQAYVTYAEKKYPEILEQLITWDDVG
jgi:DNA-binding FadR family transcriptional regulator